MSRRPTSKTIMYGMPWAIRLIVRTSCREQLDILAASLSDVRRRNTTFNRHAVFIASPANSRKDVWNRRTRQNRLDRRTAVETNAEPLLIGRHNVQDARNFRAVR